MQEITVKIKKAPHFEGNELPHYASEHAAGMDVRAAIKEPITISPGERKMIPTGLHFELPVGYEMQLRPRSGLALKHGISMVNTPGTLDADYRGELNILLINHGKETWTCTPNERIAQMIFAPVTRAKLELVEELTETQRGTGGFGSTGKH